MTKSDYKNKKSIVIYFSRADENYFNGAMKYITKGNTEVIAEYIRDITGADLFKVERKTPYSKEYMTCISEAKEEINAKARPEIVRPVGSIADYEVVYIGGPVYWGYLPQPMVTALENLDWEGKIVRPFTTHEGSGLASVPEELKKLCKGATVEPGLAIWGSSVNGAKEKVEDWI